MNMGTPYPWVRVPCSSSAATLGRGRCTTAGEAACGALEGFLTRSWHAIRVSPPKTAMNSRPWTLSQRLITTGF
jgi:hypothetical protein